MSDTIKHLYKISKLKFIVKHRVNKESKTWNIFPSYKCELINLLDLRIYTILKFSKKDIWEGSNIKNKTFTLKTPSKPNKEISVFDYYRYKYNIKLVY